MAFALKSEVKALSNLLRSLHLTKQCASIQATKRFHSDAACLQQQRPFVLPLKNIASSKPDLLQNTQCISVGPYFQQQRTYAKKPPPQKKKLSFDYSGDLVTQKPLNIKDTHVDFRNFPKLQETSDSVQKLCSIEFASGGEKKLHRKEEVKERVLQLFGNSADREMHVAMLTVDIRNMIPHVLTSRKDKLSKARLVEKIQLRKKILKYLRRTDYQRFMWLLQELRIRYVLPPEYYRRITRKFRRKQRVWEAADSLRRKKIADLKAQLEEEKADFLRHKEDTLQQIMDDAKRYNVDMDAFQKTLKRERIGKTFPRIYTWEERQEMEKEASMK